MTHMPMPARIAPALTAFTLLYSTAATAQPIGIKYAAWYPGDESIIVDANGAAWQECMGRGCSDDYIQIEGAITKAGVFKASNGYYYCQYPSELTNHHSNGKCTSDGWSF